MADHPATTRIRKLRAALMEVVEHVDNDTAADWIGKPPSDEDICHAATLGALTHRIAADRLWDILVAAYRDDSGLHVWDEYDISDALQLERERQEEVEDALDFDHPPMLQAGSNICVCGEVHQ